MIQDAKDYDLIEKDYSELLGLQQTLANLQKPYFVDINPNAINAKSLMLLKKINPEYAKIVSMHQYYSNAVLFHDNDILKRLKELKFPISLKKWFISIDDIHKQYEFIISNKIKIDKFAAFIYIKGFLVEKYRHEIQMKYVSTINDKTPMPQLTKDLIALKKRRAYSGGDPKTYKNVYDVLLNAKIIELEQLPLAKINPRDQSNIDFFIELSKGNSEVYLKKLLEECFEYDHDAIDKTHFYGIVYGLFAVIMQNRRFISEEDFDNSSHYRESSYKSFLSFKHHMLDKIFNSKAKK